MEKLEYPKNLISSLCKNYEDENKVKGIDPNEHIFSHIDDLNKSLECLSEKEHKIINMIFVDGTTVEKIGAIYRWNYAVTRMQINTILHKILGTGGFSNVINECIVNKEDNK